MRPIDADELKKSMDCDGAVKYGNDGVEQTERSYSTLMRYEIADYIDDAPTLEMEPVKQGELISVTEIHEAIMNHIAELEDVVLINGYAGALRIIHNLQTVDAEPVRHGQWIPVTERLPEIVEEVKRRDNVYRKSQRVLCSCLQESGKRFVKEGYMELFNDHPTPYWKIPGNIHSVTHWMPLPEPYREAEDDGRK